MNINQRLAAWQQFRFQLPMIICATFVIVNQRKRIWNTLKSWWNWDFDERPPEKTDFAKMLMLWVVALVISSLTGNTWRKEIVEKQQKEVVEKMLEEKVITQKELNQAKEKTEKEKRLHKAKNESASIYFLNFIFIVILAPIIEECVFRYLIFEIFGKNNPLSYFFSGLSFIFLHWLGPALGMGGGLLNFTTITFLLLNYLPLTVFLIWVYHKSKWNITYPICFHFLWNLIGFWCGVRFLR